jgi:hypothetical protein
MQADMYETVDMKLEVTMAELLINIDPNHYQEYVDNDNGKPIMFVKLQKALYGTLKSCSSVLEETYSHS